MLAAIQGLLAHAPCIITCASNIVLLKGDGNLALKMEK